MITKKNSLVLMRLKISTIESYKIFRDLVREFVMEIQKNQKEN